MPKIKILSEIWKPFSSSAISIHSASAAYYLLTSSIPAIVLLSSLLPFLPISYDILQETVSSLLPQPLHPFVQALGKYIYNNKSIVLISASAVATIWSASKGIASITDGLYSIAGKKHKSYWARRLLSVPLLIIFMLGFFLSLGVIVFSQFIIFRLSVIIPGLGRIISALFAYREILVLLVLCAFFTLIYRYVPFRDLPWRFCLLGAFLLSVSWIGLSFAFSLYVNYFSSYRFAYGSIGIVLLLTVWIRLCIQFLLIMNMYARLKWKNGYSVCKIIKKALHETI